MTAKEIKVLMVEPEKHPRVTTLRGEWGSLQKAVSIGAEYQGLIEIISLGNGDCLLCNEEGKLLGLPLNRAVRDESGEIYDIVCGTFFLCSAPPDEENFSSLSDEQIQYYTKLYQHPELFL